MAESFAIRVYKEYFNFGAAHFLLFADGSREPLHGHNYHVTVHVTGQLGPGEVVIDFIALKPVVKRLCDELDHIVLLPGQSRHLDVCELTDRVEARHSDGSFFSLPRGDVRVLPLSNTSTEMLARLLAQAIIEELPRVAPDAEISSLEVQVEESRGQAGSYRIDV